MITDSSGINSYRDTADDHDPVRGLRSAALRQLDRGVSSGTLPSRGAEIVEKLIGYGPDVERNWAPGGSPKPAIPPIATLSRSCCSMANRVRALSSHRLSVRHSTG